MPHPCTSGALRALHRSLPVGSRLQRAMAAALEGTSLGTRFLPLPPRNSTNTTNDLSLRSASRAVDPEDV